LEDIVLAVDGAEIADTCVLGLPSCSDEVPCPVHHVWKRLREQIRQSLHERTLEDLARSLEKKKKMRKSTTRGRRPGRTTRRRRRA
jgi:DNA-binding IscR family transcriptional regulator